MESEAVPRTTLTQLLICYVGLPKVLRFMVALRAIGHQAATRIRRDIPDGRPARQYLIATVVSIQELKSENAAPVTEYGEFLKRVDPNFKLTERFIAHKRTVTLLPYQGHRGHCEARLVDPSGDVHNHLLDSGESSTANNRSRCSNRPFLTKMKESFLQVFGDKEVYLIIVYSYNVPCTQPAHMCSKLISEFALRNKENIVVAYDDIHNTDIHMAWRNLMSARTYVVSPKQLHDAYAAMVARSVFNHVAMWNTMTSWYSSVFRNWVDQKR